MFIIKDNFYTNPDQVREYALSQDFSVSGNYPGLRTGPYPEPYFSDMKVEIERILNQKISYWPNTYNTAFQYTTEESKTWVHYDQTQWAAVCYLTPNPPFGTGTGIFRNKKEGFYQHADNQTDYNDINHTSEEWKLQDYCENVYNRIVIYRGSFYHSSVKAGFGKTKYDGRLFQTFFFNTDIQ